jgi:hypothetical protein
MNWADWLAYVVKDEEDPEERDRIHRLRQIDVYHLHAVDQPATRKPFLLKKEIGMKTDNMIGDGDATPTGDAVTIAKALTLPGPVKGAVEKLVTEIVERAMSLANQVKGAEEGEGGLPAAFLSELKKIGQLAASVAEKYPSPRGAKPTETQKAAPQPAAAAAPESSPAAPPAAEDPLGLEIIGQTLLDVKKAEDQQDARAKAFAMLTDKVMPALASALSPEQISALGDGPQRLAKALHPPVAPPKALPGGNSAPGDTPAPAPAKDDGWGFGDINKD